METSQPQTYIFIDGSYFCFYRYHSLLTWWKNAFPEELDVLKDPYQSEVFVNKFKKIFIETINKLPKNLGLGKNTNPIILVGKDCKRSDIWRNELFPEYKGTRGMDTSFMGGPFFKMVYEEQLFIQSGAIKILKHPKLEADDCIALSVKHLLKTNPNSKIYIVTSDKDYLQLACPQVQLFNLTYKKLTDQKSCTGNSECDLFCKLVTGDSSDNIPSVFPKCGIKTALKYYENKILFEKKLSESELYQKQYLLNKKIIDFKEIPNDLAEEFMKVWENDLKI
jgi:5'-3' exonuclease